MRYFVVAFFLILSSCECEKLPLSKDELAWIEPFERHKNFVYKSGKKVFDTLVVEEVRRFYSPCNRIELSDFQFETCDASLYFKGDVRPSDHRNLSERRDCYIRVKTLGKDETELMASTHSLFSISTGKLIPKDTVVNKIAFKSVCHFKENVNAGKGFCTNEVSEFFWKKEIGLMAYRLKNGDFFVLEAYW